MTIVEVFALLEEHGYRRKEIGELDPWWVYNVIFYPRNKKDGSLVPRKESPTDSKLTLEEAFRVRYKKLGYSDWKIDELFAEYLEECQKKKSQ